MQSTLTYKELPSACDGDAQVGCLETGVMEEMCISSLWILQINTLYKTVYHDEDNEMVTN